MDDNMDTEVFSEQPQLQPLQATTRPLNTPVIASPFATPRRRKKAQRAESPSPRNGGPALKPWPRIGKRVPLDVLAHAAEKVFGYQPHEWQLKLAVRVLEGCDAIGIAGTGSGKSLVFSLLAIAAALGGMEGVVVVISPLKSLEKDQVRRLENTEALPVYGQNSKIKLTAVAINEDNNDEDVFLNLEKMKYRVCYASPECLLRNTRFKKLFRLENFRTRVIAGVIDEAHVVATWKNEFRKDYGELETLKVIMGTEIPWLALTGTCLTPTFETIFTTLGMGGARPFYGIDRGSDRPNLKLVVRPMEYSKSSLADSDEHG